ncbi:DNA polymerase III subunit [Candidatus Uhrbacteria bacterium]|nr:DNA polymerase III subunit [Candidatus Uhrbacteria bacterium]
MQYSWPLIGHQNVRNYFTKAFSAGRIHHAYLFQGPSQVGKDTFARMLVNTLLCKDEQVRPCGKCQGCQAFARGAHPDVLTLVRGEDASIGVEKAREFIASISLKPLLGAWRIGMIEGAAQLTKEAASALLKTLEEPPLRVVLFLVSAVELLPTITSRCQRIRFGFVPAQDIAEYLAANSAAFTGTGYREVAQLAAGRPGRAIELTQPAAYETRMRELTEVDGLLDQSEAARIVFAVARFGGKGDLAEKREACLEFIEVLQYALRKRLRLDKGFVSLLKNTFKAEAYLQANVDPKLVMECLLFS